MNEPVDRKILQHIGRFRPWKRVDDGRSFYSIGENSCPSLIPAKLTKDRWFYVDSTVVRAFREAAPLTNLLMEQGLRCDLTEGIIAREFKEEVELLPSPHKPVTELEQVGFEVTRLPLPIVHHDSEQITEIDLSAKRVGEAVEKLLLGVETFPGVTGLISEGVSPMGSVYHGVVALSERRYYGPYIVVFPDSDDRGMNEEAMEEYTKNGRGNVSAVVPSKFLKGNDLIMFQASPNVVRIVVGQQIIPIQWGDKFKVLASLTPQVRRDQNGVYGIAVRR